MSQESVKNLLPSQLESSEIRREKLTVFYQKKFDEFLNHCRKGFQILIDHEIFSKDEVDLKRLPLLIYQINSKIKLQNTIQNELGISDKILLQSYSLAVELQKREQYHESENIFFFLTFLNPSISSFWIGLGFVSEILKNLQSAAFAYLMALEVDQEDLTPAISCAQCLYACHEHEKALFVLNQVIEKAGNEKKYSDVKKEYKQALELVKKHNYSDACKILWHTYSLLKTNEDKISLLNEIASLTIKTKQTDNQYFDQSYDKVAYYLLCTMKNFSDADPMIVLNYTSLQKLGQKQRDKHSNIIKQSKDLLKQRYYIAKNAPNTPQEKKFVKLFENL